MWHFPIVPVRPGDNLVIDGEEYHVNGRAMDVSSCDTFGVEHDGTEMEKHIDWFHEQVREADTVRIELGDLY